MSYPHAVDNFEPLVTPESGFTAKAEMLLGQKLPPDFISNQNPYAPLDFSKAPLLKAIYVATLVFRADFYGTVMAKVKSVELATSVAYHLQRFFGRNKETQMMRPFGPPFPILTIIF